MIRVIFVRMGSILSLFTSVVIWIHFWLWWFMVVIDDYEFMDLMVLMVYPIILIHFNNAYCYCYYHSIIIISFLSIIIPMVSP